MIPTFAGESSKSNGDLICIYLSLSLVHVASSNFIYNWSKLSYAGVSYAWNRSWEEEVIVNCRLDNRRNLKGVLDYLPCNF